jgi:hypothetical protein
MSTLDLYRFDLTVYSDQTLSSEPNKVIIPGARVQFFRQGATAAESVSIGNGSSEAVPVLDTGSLKPDDAVQIAPDGPELTVVAVVDATSVTLENDTGQSVTIPAGVRLLPLTDRPQAYQDGFGQVELGSSVTAGADGRVTCFLNVARFDYLIYELLLDRVSTETLDDSPAPLSWEHVAAANAALALVAVSWQDALGEETVTSVTFGGVAMTRVAANGAAELWSLLAPPTGPRTVTVTWDGEGEKGAVASAVTFSGPDPLSPLGAVQTSNGAGTPVAVSIPQTRREGMALDVVAVVCGLATPTLTAASGQTLRWNVIDGDTSATRTLGAGSTAPAAGDALQMSWALQGPEPPRLWRAIGIEVRSRVHVIAGDSGCKVSGSPVQVNCADFATIQAAVDALASGVGGVVRIPTGLYDSTTHPAFVPPLMIPDRGVPVHVVGDGPDLTILKPDVEFDGDLLQIRASQCTVRGLTLDGSDRQATGRGIVIGFPTAAGQPERVLFGTVLADVNIRNTAGWGLYLQGGDDVEDTLSIFSRFDRVRITNNRADGGIYLGAGCTTLTFADCSVAGFLGNGLKAKQSSGLFLQACTFEDSRNPEPNPFDPTAVAYVHLSSAFVVKLDGCWFEHHEVDSGDFHFVVLGDDDEAGQCGNVIIDGGIFVHREQPSARIVRILGPSHQIQIRNPRLALNVTPASTDDIIIPATAVVTVVGGEITTPATYYPLRIQDAGKLTCLFGPTRLRVPRVEDDDGLEELVDAKMGDVVYHEERERLLLYLGVEDGWKAVTVEDLEEL